MTEKEKFFAHFKVLKDAGMKSVRFTLKPGGPPVSENEFYAELNRMIEARDLPDFEVLGKYSHAAA